MNYLGLDIHISRASGNALKFEITASNTKGPFYKQHAICADNEVRVMTLTGLIDIIAKITLDSIMLGTTAKKNAEVPEQPSDSAKPEDDRWWENSDSSINQIDSSYERGITDLRARKLADGTWQYATVHMFYGDATLEMLIHNGEVLYGGDDD